LLHARGDAAEQRVRCLSAERAGGLHGGYAHMRRDDAHLSCLSGGGLHGSNALLRHERQLRRLCRGSGRSSGRVPQRQPADVRDDGHGVRRALRSATPTVLASPATLRPCRWACATPNAEEEAPATSAPRWAPARHARWLATMDATHGCAALLREHCGASHAMKRIAPRAQMPARELRPCASRL
jgi:hypothetical protein